MPAPTRDPNEARPAGADVALLLEQSDWIRALALRLVGDAHAADDLVQDTWVAALRSPERPRSPRGFLATILRNLLRDRRASERHRATREHDVARPEAQPSAEELVGELQAQRRVAAAVLDLEEPLRTPLLLRYWRSASLEEIARHQGVAVSTVHERLQRGVRELRKRLDDAHGGDRGAWAGVLIPLCRSSSVASTTLREVLAVSSTQKIAALFLAVVTGLCGLWWLVDDARSVESEALARAAVPVDTPPALAPEPEPVDDADRARTAATTSRPHPSATAPVPAATFAGRVVDIEGQPVEGLAVAAGEDEGTTSDADGRFELPRPKSDNEHVLASSELWTTVVPGVAPRAGEADEETLVVVARRQTIAGWVSDDEGTPLANVELRVHVSGSLFRDLGLLRHWRTEPDPITTTSGPNGEFELELAGGPHLRLAASPPGHAPYNEAVPAGDVRDLQVVLARTRGPETLFGTVVDESGLPVEDAFVAWLGRVVRTDAEGRFRIAKPDSNLDFLEGLGRETNLDVLRAVKPGHLPTELALDDLPPSPIELVLGGEPLSISGRIVDAEGRPRRAVVWVLDEAPLGHVVQQGGEGDTTISFGVLLESYLRGSDDTGERGIQSAEDGTFELGGLVDRFYRLHAFDPATWAATEPVEIRAGTHGIELVLPAADVSRVQGRVTSFAGDPLSGLRIAPRRTFDGQMAPWGPWQTTAATTDEDGRFDIPKLALAGTRLTYHSEEINFFEGHALEDLAREQDLDDLEIRLPRVARLQVDLTHREPDFARHFGIEDEDGHALDVAVFEGNMMYMTPRAPIQAGKSVVVQTDERASTLVLYRDSSEILRTPLELAAEGTTTLRP